MDTIKLLLSHRSIRKFKQQPIEKSLLDRILECGTRAANTGNMQIYSIIVTQTPENIAALSKLHFGQCSTAGAFLTLCVDVNRYHHWCRINGCNEPYDNFLWLMSGTVDASLAAQNICIAAEAEGLGCCYLGTVMYNTKAIIEQLDLPKQVIPVITLALGYPSEQPALSERLPLSGIVHNEQYHDYSDEAIKDIHRVREEFPFNKEMVEVNKVKNLAELFTQKRYPKDDNVRISNDLLKVVTDRGMMNQ